MSRKVREFTLGAKRSSPDTPEPMSEEEVDFISKMILDEVMELQATVCGPEKAKAKLKQMIDTSKDIPRIEYGPDDPEFEIADQADALVDIEYYIHDMGCRKGMNLERIFNLVHEANMAKRDPRTNEFIIREDGKIMKPEGWNPPSVSGEIYRQMSDGSWDA